MSRMAMSDAQIKDQCLALKLVVGIRVFEKLTDGAKKLPEKLEPKQQKKIGKRQKKFYMLGQNYVISDVFQVANDLLRRDYDKIYKFDGNKPIGATFVPEGKVPI